MTTKVSGIALMSIAAGGTFIYAGIKGYSIPQTIQNMITGKTPTTQAQIAPIGTPAGGATGTAPVTGIGGLPGGGGSPAANKVLGKFMAASYGWATGNEWAYLETGWEAESGWSTTAAYDKADPYNHAYGIPQANPGSKMASAGANWKTSAATQIAWGLAYIKATYGSPTQVPKWSANGPLPGYVGY